MVDARGWVVNYRHTLYGVVLLALSLVAGVVALLLAGKDTAALVTFGGLLINGLMTLLVTKTAEDVKREVNGNTSALIEKIPSPPVAVDVDGAPLTAEQLAIRTLGAAARNMQAAGAPAVEWPRCPVPVCDLPRGHVGEH